MKMIDKRMNVLAMAIIGLGATPALAQTSPVAETMDHAQHQSAPSPDAVKPKAARDAMPAMDSSGMDHGAMPGMKSEKPETAGEMPAMDHSEMSMQGGSAPPDARDPHAYSDGYTLESGPYALPGPRVLRLSDEHTFGGLLVDRLEQVHARDGDNATAYEIQGWYGRDYNRLVVKAEGDVSQGKLQEARTELLWGHAIATFWDTQLGMRYDSGVSPDRGWLAFGVQGLAPYWFEVDAAAYVGDKGRTAFRLGAEYELLLTQKLVLQPRLEINAYGKSDEALGIGSGLSDGVAGLRLRYEFTRQFAPYVGVERAGKFGKTADLARTAGEKTDETRWVAGVRFWF
ncbi:MAG: copper resistance protein B [Thiobacillus sp.]